MKDEARCVGNWAYDVKNSVLILHDADEHWLYEVDLDECKTCAQILDWLCQISGKNWSTPEITTGLLLQLDRIFKLQANYCSWGEDKTIPKTIPS